MEVLFVSYQWAGNSGNFGFGSDVLTTGDIDSVEQLNRVKEALKALHSGMSAIVILWWKVLSN